MSEVLDVKHALLVVSKRYMSPTLDNKDYHITTLQLTLDEVLDV